jgi:hypothetical protein
MSVQILIDMNLSPDWAPLLLLLLCDNTSRIWPQGHWL